MENSKAHSDLSNVDHKVVEQLFGKVLGNLPVSVFRLEMNASGHFFLTYISEASASLLGCAIEERLETANAVLAHLDITERLRLLKGLRRSRRRHCPLDEEISFKTVNGDKVWLRFFANPEKERNGKNTFWDGAAIDITAQRLLDERLCFLAYHDATTQMPNRLALEEYLDARLSEGNGDLAVLALAIDRLDLVNDTLGQDTANRLVRTVANQLASNVPQGAYIAHPRAESFCIVLQNITQDREVGDLAEKLLEAMKLPFDVGTRRLDVSVSVGISVSSRDGEDGAALLMNAETALRRAHQTSPGGYRFYVEEMNTRALRVLAYENRLRKALSRNEFVPFFQPLVDMKTGKIAAMEALVRWKHPRLGLIFPGEFIPVAEEAGLIGEICYQVLYQTCVTAKKWLNAGYEVIPLAINISWRQFSHPERLLQLMNEIFTQTGIPPEMIELELTESSVMEEPDSAIRTLNDLREFGVMASIDDFGTGYSSLSYLKRLPISKLKIDRAFILEVTHNERDAAIVDAIIRLARALGLKTVAEGIETREQYDFLNKMGCDLAQGYYFSKPVPAEDMEKMLQVGGFSIV